MSQGDHTEFIEMMDAEDPTSIELEQMTQEEFFNEV